MAGAGAGAGVVGGLFGLAQSGMQYALNRKLQVYQQRFQREMSSTAHQRQVKDLRKAGLNPILSAGMSGSSTPPGASASVSAPDIVGSAMKAYMAKSQKDLLSQQLETERGRTAVNTAQAAGIGLDNQRKGLEMSEAELRNAVNTHWLGRALRQGGYAAGGLVNTAIGAATGFAAGSYRAAGAAAKAYARGRGKGKIMNQGVPLRVVKYPRSE